MTLLSNTDELEITERNASAQAIFGEQVALLYRLSRSGYAGTLINALIIGGALWSVTPRLLLLTWLALVAAVTVARYVLYKSYRASSPQASSAPLWARRFVVGATAMGCLWGILGSALLPPNSAMHQFLIVFLVGGMVASALMVLTPVKQAFMGFMLPALLPLVIAVFVQNTEMHLFMGALLAVYFGVVVTTLPIMHKTHYSSVRSRFENTALVGRLSALNSQADATNRRMTEQLQEQKIIEEALQQSTERLEALIESSPLAIIVHDEHGIINRWNPAAERMFGWSQDEVVGKLSPTTTTDAQAQAARLAELISSGKEFSYVEAIRQRKDGNQISVSISAAPLRDAAGTPSGRVVMISDISERRKSEQLQLLGHTVTKLLSESHSVEEAMARVLQTIGEFSGWVYGARWVLDAGEDRMQCKEVWHIDQPEITAFAEINRERRETLTPGKGGLLRAVWHSGAPVWISDLAADGTLRRTEQLANAGLRAAFAFPVLIGGKCYGVLEFFAPAVRMPDDALTTISPAIGSQVGQFIARKEAESRLTFFANHDSLTGLPNRAMFSQQLTQALARAQRVGKMVAVLFIDLDRFKVINDTLGHDAGDRLLKQLAAQLRLCLREGDTIGRQGGDEFVVLVEEVADPNQISGVAHKIIETVARPYMLSGQEVHVTGSIGISIYPDDGNDAQTLLKNADIAMYRAKDQGRNNLQFYSAHFNRHTFERLALETSLRRAVERHEFLLHYQPKVDIRSGRITGVEALVRWQRPDTGMVPPAQFIPLAEETGLIAPIGSWVLHTACAQARAWIAQGLPAISMAVNLSARQFERDGLADAIAEVLRDTGLSADLLELEITESAVMHNADRAAQVLQQLKQMGVRVAIDDFGTGYSSLGYLKRFPIDSVKIDRSFIRDIPGDRDDVAITQAVIAMAHSLRLKVIAEGVETEGQYCFLRDHHCDEMQGYFYSPPVGATELVKFLVAPPAQLVPA